MNKSFLHNFIFFKLISKRMCIHSGNIKDLNYNFHLYTHKCIFSRPPQSILSAVTTPFNSLQEFFKSSSQAMYIPSSICSYYMYVTDLYLFAYDLAKLAWKPEWKPAWKRLWNLPEKDDDSRNINYMCTMMYNTMI